MENAKESTNSISIIFIIIAVLDKLLFPNLDLRILEGDNASPYQLIYFHQNHKQRVFTSSVKVYDSWMRSDMQLQCHNLKLCQKADIVHSEICIKIVIKCQ